MTLLRSLIKGHKNTTTRETIPIIERWMKEDPDYLVRYKAIELRGLIALEHENKVCPLCVALALFDKDVNVLEAVVSVTGLMKEFSPEVIATVLAAAKTEGTERRFNVLMVVGLIADRSEEARNVISNARSDTDFRIRYNANGTWFRVTGDLDGLIRHCLRIQAEFSNLPLAQSGSTDGEQLYLKQVMLFGVQRKLQQQGEEETDKVASAILECSASESPLLRRGTAIFIGFLADAALKARGKTGKSKESNQPADNYFSNEPLDSSKLLARLSELGIEGALLKLERSDSDAEVREAARDSLKKWSALKMQTPKK